MDTTDDITNAILKYLNFHGAAWRTNMVHVRRRKMPKDQQGIGDIVGSLKPLGRHIEVEVKREGDYLRPSQIRHMERVREAGGIYLVVYSFDDFLQAVGYVQSQRTSSRPQPS